MYVNKGKIDAFNDNVVLKIEKWPSSFTSNIIIQSGITGYDNGKELYLGKVISSDNDSLKEGQYVGVDMYFGSHLPSEIRTEKLKIVPYTGIVLKGTKKFTVMSDIIKMSPGKGRVLVKLKKKETITSSGIHIPLETLAQDPTAQDVRFAEVVKSSSTSVKKGEIIVIESFVGKDIYLNEDKELYIVCYINDILAKMK
ncbi:MAG: hypothetical protein KAH32_04640 [Chlamydiia bacterium]|nr:hypothetical protein [Chlamydiia bacterium]